MELILADICSIKLQEKPVFITPLIFLFQKRLPTLETQLTKEGLQMSSQASGLASNHHHSNYYVSTKSLSK